MARHPAPLKAIVLDDALELSLSDICHACGVHAEFVIELVNEGVLEPRGRNLRSWRFSGRQLGRAQAAARLQRDLDLNLAGIGLALDLIDELEALRTRLRVLEDLR